MADLFEDALDWTFEEPIGRMRLAAGMLAAAILLLVGVLLGEPLPLKLGFGLLGLVLIGLWTNARARWVFAPHP